MEHHCLAQASSHSSQDAQCCRILCNGALFSNPIPGLLNSVVFGTWNILEPCPISLTQCFREVNDGQVANKIVSVEPNDQQFPAARQRHLTKNYKCHDCSVRQGSAVGLVLAFGQRDAVPAKIGKWLFPTRARRSFLWRNHLSVGKNCALATRLASIA